MFFDEGNRDSQVGHKIKNWVTIIPLGACFWYPQEKSNISISIASGWKMLESNTVRPLIFNNLSTGCTRIRFWTLDYAYLHRKKEIFCSFVFPFWFLISLLSLNVWIETSSWRLQTRKKWFFLFFFISHYYTLHIVVFSAYSGIL